MTVSFHLIILQWFAGFPFLVQEEISFTKHRKDVGIEACVIRVFVVNFDPKFNISLFGYLTLEPKYDNSLGALTFQSLFLIISFVFFPENAAAKFLNLMYSYSVTLSNRTVVSGFRG